MNNWQLTFQTPVDLTEHLRKPYLLYDEREKDVSKVIFDEHANLLWAGDTYGRVSSYDPAYALYTRHAGHIGAAPVVDMLSHASGIMSLSADSLNFASRQGVTRLNLTSADIAQLCDMKAMCFASNAGNHVYCAGANPGSGIIDIDLQKGALANNIDYASKVKLLRSDNKTILVGKQAGSIDLLDQNSNQLIKSFAGHSAAISDMDIRDNTLVTVGKSRRFNQLCSDPFVNIYDLRMMRQLTPVAFSHNQSMNSSGSAGADFVRLHPILPTVMTVASTSGAFDFIDLANPALRSQYCHPCHSISQFQLSSSGDYIALLEHDNNINTWSRSNGMSGFSNSSAMLEYPDFPDDGPTKDKISPDDQYFPLSSVGMPYYSEKLLSAWPHVIFRSSGTLPRRFNETIQTTQNASSRLFQLPASNSQTFQLVPYNVAKFGRRNVVRPYRSLRERKKKLLVTDEDGTDKKELMRYRPVNEFEVPPAYTKLQMVYGKYGVEDFDFKAFNQTNLSGLESDIENSYTNAVLQMYRFVPEFYNFVVSCLKDDTWSEISLLAELGYLYDMMDKANGVVCRSSNFQKAMTSLPEVDVLGLLKDSLTADLRESFAGLEVEDQKDESGCKSNLTALENNVPQRFNDFILRKLISEEVQKKINTTHSIALEELFGIQLATDTRTISTCDSYEKRSSIVPALTITSPASNNAKYSNKKLNNQTVLPYIESSMNRVKHRRAVCGKCHKPENVEFEKTVRNLPPLLSLNISMSNDEWAVAKSVKNWLVKEFYATLSKDRPILKLQPTDLKTTNAIFKYDLNAYVARITDDLSEPHLVTYAKIYDQKSRHSKWFMFNDYLVVEVDEEEALDVSPWWKTPEILVYSDAEELRKPFVPATKFRINDSILYRDHFANGIKTGLKKEYKLLTKSEPPHFGSLIAMDAEFVVLADEQVEISCRGQRTLINPKKTALARISVLRGNDGEDFGVPFIDDYVVNTNHIENYLTRYSGIEPGDLDPVTSTKTLAPRQMVYRKIWLLLQMGCVFVGHGLYNDFRNINIYVPPEQIRDTALYFLQGKRYLALRFLAHALLGSDVQSGNHDSIEDAYTALVLYKKYLELMENNIFEATLNQLYEDGRACGFKVPGDRSSTLV
ncbi:LANO_0F01134g1_1 [Lachancea nothofagi CBS 11611]|uniref:PAN2-PAN3 deadenylation complex catalytic subunit PAN2 n=1 Tax=Lachancea nothofagi CBS 11611 TaxID=1266666 RepID=A0A1G4K5W5_9SACH|nr:LANO_0F01134g1_1 [Lachancea nothofagi CBS 11611]